MPIQKGERPLDAAALVTTVRARFATGVTRPLAWRRRQLERLLQMIADHEPAILEALAQDMRRPPFEGFVGEVHVVRQEARYALKHLAEWMKPRRVPTSLVHLLASSAVHPEPLGVVLIIGPWNYPFQLVFSPLVAALAAGNCAIVKPSEVAAHTSQLTAQLVRATFDASEVAVVEGGRETTRELLAQRFDHIFYTGGAAVGRVVLKAAAEHLTPVTLELGGKSPCIVERDVQLEYTARRIVWGKFFNAGQTCVAPDYLLVQESIKEPLLAALREQLTAFYGENPSLSPDYGRIIDQQHYQRLVALLGEGRVVAGGQHDVERLYLAPTILDEVPPDGRLMQEEIFGPLLPVLTYGELDEAIEFVNARPRPLALYFFSRDRAKQDRVLARTSSGGSCINDTIIQLDSQVLPFGGVGESGVGSYHGKFGFETFSHLRAVMRRSFLLDLPLRYPPFGNKLPLVRRLLGAF